MKYYAVKAGRQTGIFTSWPEAQKQVTGFSGAQFKSFTSQAEAQAYLEGSRQKASASSSKPASAQVPQGLYAYVDGSFNKLTKRYGSGVVMLKNGQVLDKLSFGDSNDKFSDSFQIAGEVFGSLRAIKWAKEAGYQELTIYYDYLGIERWATKEWKANKPISQAYQTYFDAWTQGMTVHFEKVKAHTGVEFNELADQLAKAAVGLA